jgi:hypothetical protein
VLLAGGDDGDSGRSAAGPSGPTGATGPATSDGAANAGEGGAGTVAAEAHPNRKSDEIPKAPPLAERGIIGGIADDQPAALADPRLHALGLKHARVTVSWDLAIRGARPGAAPDPARFPALADEHARLQAWFAEARRAGLTKVLVAVRSSRGSGGLAPSRGRYRAAVRDLLRWLDRIGYGRYIEAVSPWNEPNLSSVTRSRPEIASGYFDEVRALCAARGCTPVAGEFADRPVDANVLRHYAAAIPPPSPTVWGWHAYEDGWDRGSDASLPRLRTLLGVAAPDAQVWLTEQGGIVRRHFPGDDGRTNQSVQAAAADLGFLLKTAPAVDRRIKRYYLYQWRGEPAPRWDSGVIAPGGQARVSFCVFARAAAARLPAGCR